MRAGVSSIPSSLEKRVWLSFDSIPNLGQSDAAEEQAVCRLRIRPCFDMTVGPLLSEFGNDVGVEQPPIHNSTSRTGLRLPSSPNFMRLRGDWDRSSCKLADLPRARRASKASAATMTTASFPWTVMRCGCPAMASRTISPKPCLGLSQLPAGSRRRPDLSSLKRLVQGIFSF